MAVVAGRKRAREAASAHRATAPAPAVAAAAAAAPGHRNGGSKDAGARPDLADRLHTDDWSSDDEDAKNTVGGVPMEWYRDYDHIGYDVSGRRIAKRPGVSGIDRFLASQDNPDFAWTIYDEENDEEIVLSKRDVQLIRNIHAGRAAHPEYDETAARYSTAGIFTNEVEIHPLNGGTEPKRRFVPSKWEMKRVNRIVASIHRGTYVRRPKKPVSEEADRVYLMWGADDMVAAGVARGAGPIHIPAPKMPLPGHVASYNPPPEYLLTEEEKKAWAETDPAKRPINFIPQRYSSLRTVPLYAAGVRERFDRCLDLYLCPRTFREKLNVDPESLLPKLPDPAELRPFPTTIAVSYEGHTSRIRSLSIDPTGVHLASASDDKTVRVWHIPSGRCLHTWSFPAVPQCVAWNPNPMHAAIAVVVEDVMYLIYPGTARPSNVVSTWRLLAGSRRTRGGGAATAGSGALSAAAAAGSARKVVDAETGQEIERGGAAGAESDDDGAGTEHPPDGEDSHGSGSDSAGVELSWALTAEWAALRARLEAAEAAAGEADDNAEVQAAAAAFLLPRLGGTSAAGIAVTVKLSHFPRRVVWHGKGDYIATASPTAETGAVLLHQVSKFASTNPFAKTQGRVQAVAFHPRQPWLYVANQTTVRIYDLAAQTLVKKLQSGAKWLCSMDLHPSGDHMLLGSFDHRTIWFDTELSEKPFKTLRYHTKAVRRATFHQHLPLMATASDDGAVHIFHARVFNDYVNNPLIVPLKVLRGHTVSRDGLGVLDAAFHPSEPWLVTCGADGTMHLWHNLP